LQPLQWNNLLVPYARSWAETLVTHCDGVQDLEQWANLGEMRPHDPNSYSEKPPMGENIHAAQGQPDAIPEATVVEQWYREVETECPNQGRSTGCGGGKLNHFTTMMWRDASDVGCAAVARQTPFGPYIVTDCRYASRKGNTMHHCQTPNTRNCDGPMYPEDGNQVPALVAGSCPVAAVMPAPVVGGLPAEATLAQQASICIGAGVLGKCDKCLYSDQCGGGRYCCPFMKKCVLDGHEQCSTPIAMCMPPCPESIDPKECQCKEEGRQQQHKEFPCLWQRPLCGRPLSCTPEEMTRPVWMTDLGDGTTPEWRLHRAQEKIQWVKKQLGPVMEALGDKVHPYEQQLDGFLGIQRERGATTPWALALGLLLGACLCCTGVRVLCFETVRVTQPGYRSYRGYGHPNQRFLRH